VIQLHNSSCWLGNIASESVIFALKLIDFQWQNQELSPNRDTVALQSRVLEKENIKIQIFQKIFFFRNGSEVLENKIS